MRGSAPEAAALWSRYFETRSLEARNALVERYLYLVMKVIVARWGRKLKSSEQHYLSPEELEGYGAAGLIKGIESYDPSKRAAPETWLSSRIHWAVLDGLAEYDPLRRVDRARVKRGEMREPKVAQPLLMSQVARDGPEVAGPAPGGAAFMNVLEVEDALRALGALPPETVELVLYRHVEGLSQRDIAALHRGGRPLRREQGVPRSLRRRLAIADAAAEAALAQEAA